MFTFSKPENINKNNYFDILSYELSRFKSLINSSLEPEEIPIVIGGDNCVTFSSLLALIERVRDTNKIGYIQFDSHGEVNLYRTSPTKNFHGMYLRPFLDSFDIPQIKSLIPSKLVLNNTLFIGDLDLDTKEKAYFKKENLRNINKDIFLKNKRSILKEIDNFLPRHEYLHINFDIDVFSSKEVIATGIPSPKGFMFDEIAELLKIIFKHKNLSVDLCEVNPLKNGAKQTIGIAQKILMMLM